MSEFTMRLKDVLELERFEERGPSVIGLASYPIFDADYRETLNEKIIRRYYTREIGHESIAMFRHAMNREMHEIMPYYNQLYRSERLEIDPLSTVNLRNLATNDFTNSTDTTGTANTTTENETQAGGESLGMEYPQQQLNEDGRYATTGSKSENASTSTGAGEESQSSNTTSEGDSTGETVQTGWSGSQADLLNRYRETFLNIDVMILDALNPLFMGIWGNGNSHYSDRHMGPWRAWF